MTKYEVAAQVRSQGRGVGKVARMLTAAVGVGVLLSVGAGTAGAWPIPITPEEQGVINRGHAAGWPGDDDAVLMAARQACQALMTGQGTQGATDALVGMYGADPGVARQLVNIAHGTLCTSARG
ncbi:MAG: DUF732 domain-containing protein [Mycobacterium sp.]